MSASSMGRESLKPARRGINFAFLLPVLLGLAVGLWLASVALPRWLPGLAYSLAGDQPKAYWFLSRGSGFAGFILLWLSMVSGLIVTDKLARIWPGGRIAVDMHEYFSLLGLGLGLFHGLILMGDRYINFNLLQLLVPFASSNYRPVWVGLGQVSLYLGLLVSLTFYVRKRITPRVWRLIHYLSFAQFLLVLAHGIFSGTDSGTPWAIQLYWWSAASLVFLFIYRMLLTRVRVQR